MASKLLGIIPPGGTNQKLGLSIYIYIIDMYESTNFGKLEPGDISIRGRVANYTQRKAEDIQSIQSVESIQVD